jgi:hypothetical protein
LLFQTWFASGTAAANGALNDYVSNVQKSMFRSYTIAKAMLSTYTIAKAVLSK